MFHIKTDYDDATILPELFLEKVDSDGLLVTLGEYTAAVALEKL